MHPDQLPGAFGPPMLPTDPRAVSAWLPRRQAVLARGRFLAVALWLALAAGRAGALSSGVAKATWSCPDENREVPAGGGVPRISRP